MSKESEIVIRIINNQKQIEDLKIRGEEEQKERHLLEEKNKKEFFLRKSEEVMGKLGVTKIFEELRDSGVIRYSNTRPHYGERNTLFGKKSVIIKPYIPAEIGFSDTSIAVFIKFDESYDDNDNSCSRIVSVRQEEDRKITINGSVIESREKIPELIATAILAAQGKIYNSK